MKLFPSRDKTDVAISQHWSSTFPVWSEMCIESMESKHGKSDYLRGTMKPGTRPGWHLPPRFIMEQPAGAYIPHWANDAVRPTQNRDPRLPKRPQPGSMETGAGSGWNHPPQFFHEQSAEACNHYWPNNAMRTNQQCVPRQQKRPHPGNYAGGPAPKMSKKKQMKMAAAAARLEQQPVGAMAPGNTTQYIMANQYENTTIDDDVETTKQCFEPLTTDSGYDGCLAFQQRDFEEEFALYWQPE